jgi:O-antigen ligase
MTFSFGTSVRDLFIKKRYDIILLMMAAMFPLYGYAVSSSLFIVFAAVSILMNLKRLKEKKESLFSTKKIKYFLLTVGYYLILVLSLFYTTDLADGLLSLQYRLYLLAYPLLIIFFVEDITLEDCYVVCFAFVISCCIFITYLHFNFFEAGLYTHFRPALIYDLPFRDVVMNLKNVAVHPTYATMWFLFSALFLANYFFENIKKISLLSKFAYAFVFLYLILSSILLSAKITFLAFFIVFLLLLFLYIKSKIVLILSIFAALMLFIWSITNISFLKSRFIDEYLITEFKPPVGIQTNSLNIRVGIHECSMALLTDNWAFGTGIGDLQHELNKCYKKFNTQVYQTDTYNTHNNYMDILLSAGIPGLSAFIFMLMFHLTDSIKKGNRLFIIFLVFTMICMLPENILSRNHGVVFFSLFVALFVKLNLGSIKNSWKN